MDGNQLLATLCTIEHYEVRSTTRTQTAEKDHHCPCCFRRGSCSFVPCIAFNTARSAIQTWNKLTLLRYEMGDKEFGKEIFNAMVRLYAVECVFIVYAAMLYTKKSVSRHFKIVCRNVVYLVYTSIHSDQCILTTWNNMKHTASHRSRSVSCGSKCAPTTI